MKLKLITLVLVVCFVYIPSIAHNSRIADEYQFAKSKFKWVERDFYYYLDYRCNKKKIDILFALSLAQAESDGRNVRSRKKNKNGTYDWSRFQINELHMPKNPRRLLNDRIQINLATWYLGMALKKAKGDLELACIYYNGGLNCNVSAYRNSKELMEYPKKILKIYNSITTKI